MNRLRMLALLVFTLLSLAVAALAQEDAPMIEPKDPDMVNPEAHISFPPPVYVIRDTIDIRGTVTLASMRSFYIEVRALALDAMMDDGGEESPWLPATMPQNEAVTEGVLGSWSTVTQPDGLYELRLTVNTGGAAPEHYRVSPIRIENDPPPFAPEPQGAAMDAPAEQPADAQPAEAPAEAPAAAQPEPTDDPRPRVIATVNANVRAGDSTLYRVIGHLLEGDSALVKGISAYGTGWYYIELANGRSGFIYPHIVTPEGDFDNLPRINPPPLPPTPIPVPTAVPPPPQPQSNVDLVIGNVQIKPHPVKCGESYEIQVLVRNVGSGDAPQGGIVVVEDRGQAGAGPAQTTRIAYGALRAGTQQLVVGHLSPSVHVETLHHVNLRVDADNTVVEMNEGNNAHATQPYILGKGSC